MRLALFLPLVIACNSAERVTPRAACGVDDPCGAGEVCVEGSCVTVAVLPTSTLGDTPAALTRDPAGQFWFSGGPGAVSFVCVVDDRPEAPCSAPYAVEVGEGEHTFTVIALGAGGEREAVPPSYHWVVDLTAPVATIVGAPPPVTNQTRWQVMVSADDPEATILCSVDGGPEEPCPASLESASGDRSLTVWAVDRAGNRSAPARAAWRVDTTVPATYLDDSPLLRTREQTASFRFSANKPGVHFRCQLDAQPVEACDDGTKMYAGLPAGARRFLVVAVDEAGVADPVGAEWRWEIDRTPPVVAISSPAAGQLTPRTVSVTYDVSGATRVDCALGGVALPCQPSPMALPALGSGGASFAVTATDDVGWTTTVTRSWTVDATPPVVTITPPAAITGPAVSLTYSRGDATECAVDGGAWGACPASPIALSYPTSGTKTFRLKGRDGLGNESADAVVSWTVDADPPAVSITAPSAGGTTGKEVDLRFTVGDATACSIDGGGYTACPASPLHRSYTSGGDKTFTLRGRDAYANQSALASVTFTVDATPPVVTITPPAAITGPAVSLTYSRGDATECAVDGGGWGACPASPIALSYPTSGTKTFRLKGRDGFGNESGDAVVTWTVDADPPAVSITAPSAGGTTGKEVDLRFTVGDATACSIDGGGYTACPASPLHRSYTSGGDKTFTLRGRDAYANQSALISVTFTVDATPPVVTITPPAAITGPAVSLSYSRGDATECAVDGGGWGACPASPIALSYPTSGTKTFRLKGRDGYGNESADAVVTWIVDATPPVVVVDDLALGPTTRTVLPVSFQVTEANGYTTTCLLDDVEIVCPSGQPSITTGSAGEHRFCMTAVDVVGNSGTDCADWRARRGVGHRVVLGWDFDFIDDKSAPGSRELAAAVSLSGNPGDLRILEVVGTGSSATAVAKAHEPIDAFVRPHEWVRVKNAAELAAHGLRGVDVVLIHDLQNVDQAAAFYDDPALRLRLADFVRDGGVLVVLDGLDDAGQKSGNLAVLYGKKAGLELTFDPPSISWELVVFDPADPLGAVTPSRFPSGTKLVAYRSPEIPPHIVGFEGGPAVALHYQYAQEDFEVAAEDSWPWTPWAWQPGNGFITPQAPFSAVSLTAAFQGPSLRMPGQGARVSVRFDPGATAAVTGWLAVLMSTTKVGVRFGHASDPTQGTVQICAESSCRGPVGTFTVAPGAWFSVELRMTTPSVLTARVLDAQGGQLALVSNAGDGFSDGVAGVPVLATSRPLRGTATISYDDLVLFYNGE